MLALLSSLHALRIPSLSSVSLSDMLGDGNDEKQRVKEAYQRVITKLHPDKASNEWSEQTRERARAAFTVLTRAYRCNAGC